jgi:uncharacterized YigZ family protein
MGTTSEYKSISSISRGEYREKGSRFIGIAYPVHSEDEVKEIMAGLKKEYHDARHHCFAYVIGPDKEFIRAYDDGEPSHSAGQPILTQIETRDLTNILVVVIRYFGGTLLGVGGLINAYKSTASNALEKANIYTRTVKERYRLEFEYPQMNAIMSLVKEKDLNVISRSFELSCSILIEIPKEKAGAFLERCRRIEKLHVSKE